MPGKRVRSHVEKTIRAKPSVIWRSIIASVEFIRWVGGDERCELRLACRSCNAKHQPKRKRVS
jgi:hypothetical protein